MNNDPIPKLGEARKRGRPKKALSLAQTLMKDSEFLTDMCRFSEGLLSEKFLRRKYGNLSEADFEILGESEELIEKIEAEAVRRMRSGATAAEKAQKVFVRTPDILAAVADDPKQSARHRIDACREIRATSAVGGPEHPNEDKFTIIIDLSRSTELNPNNPNPNDNIITINATPNINSDEDKLLTAITANKRTTGNDGGEPL